MTMDKDLKKLIKETMDHTFAESPEKLVERGIREIQYDICPHCKTEIHEKHEYTEDGGVTWRHSDCKGMISRPETPLDEVSSWLRPYVKEARIQRHNARKELGMKEAVSAGFTPDDQTEKTDLPPSGEEKYRQQEPTGPMSAVNIEELNTQNTERKEIKPIGVRDHASFMDKSVIVVNASNIPIKLTINEFTSDVDGIIAKSYMVNISNG